MKKLVALFVAVGLLLFSVAGMGAGAVLPALLFGWISFLMRVLPKVSVSWPDVAVGCTAAVLLCAGVHWAGRSWQRRAGRTWKVRWSLITVLVVGLLFAAGISVIGIVHQAAWLLNSHQPLMGETVRPWGGSTGNLKQIGMAMGNYQDTFGHLPPGGTFAEDGAMLHSWETELLPCMWYDTHEIDRRRPWNDPRNQKYFQCVVPEFINPDLGGMDLTDAEGYGLSHYAANCRVLTANHGLPGGQSTANTLLVGEVNAQFKPWGSPVNWRDPVRGINRSPSGFGGPRGSGGANFLVGDGSVRFVSERVSPEVLRAMSTPGGTEGGGSETLEPPH